MTLLTSSFLHSASLIKHVQYLSHLNARYNAHAFHITTGSEQGSVVVLDWRASSDGDFWSKYQPHTRDVTQLTFAPWKLALLPRHCSLVSYIHVHVVVLLKYMYLRGKCMGLHPI